MCCFSSDVRNVANTRIFARRDSRKQVLAYEMSYSADVELAMVLPIPVPPRSPESAVRFFNLEECDDFFGEIESGFVQPKAASSEYETFTMPSTLQVHDVGAFEASFVPAPTDFARLDERFRIEPKVWLGQDIYRDYGFAVFKLKAAERSRAHAMAFGFPTRDPERIFFPTLHIHDRELTRSAFFDHTFYLQAQERIDGWEKSRGPASEFIRSEPAKPLFDLAWPCQRRKLYGRFQNIDTWVGNNGVFPKPAPRD